MAVARADRPRIPPGTREEIGRVNFTLARLLGAVAGTGPPNLFTTLARHPRLFRPWLRFAGALMPGGRLPRADTELLILRVAHNCGCEYEWQHHERLGAEVGLSPTQIESARLDEQAEDFSPRQALLLRAADELHAGRRISDELWTQLRPVLSDTELIELCMLVGHYEMLAMTINTLVVQPDAPDAGSQKRWARMLRTAARRRRGREGKPP
jgi:AhpD family alkylhydroperoxidase